MHSCRSHEAQQEGHWQYYIGNQQQKLPTKDEGQNRLHMGKTHFQLVYNHLLFAV